jgi:hypothetical protein
MLAILRKGLTVRGFINYDFAAEHYPAFLREVGAGIADGRIRYREDFVDGLEKAPEAFIGMPEGRNFGKLIVRVDGGAKQRVRRRRRGTKHLCLGQKRLPFLDSAVHLLIRRTLGPSMSEYLVERVRAASNVVVHEQAEIEALHGGGHLEAIRLRNHVTGTATQLPCAAVFVFIGADPAAEWLPAEIARDTKGFGLAAGQSMSKSLLEASRRIDGGDRGAKLVVGN